MIMAPFYPTGDAAVDLPKIKAMYSPEHGQAPGEFLSKSRRLLVLSVSAGAGHVRAAQAVEAAARAAQPPLDVTHLDLLTLVPKEFRKLYGEQYIKLVEKLPQLWSYLYAKTDRPSRDSLVGKLKRAAEKLNTRKLNCGN